MTPIAFVALHWADAHPHPELREIAVLRAEPSHAEPTHVYASRVRSVYGKREDDASAVWLVDAMDQVRELTRGCTLVGIDTERVADELHRLCEDWELLPLELGEQRIDLGSLAWPMLVSRDATGADLASLCIALDVPVPHEPHALEAVSTQAEIYRRLLACLAPSPALRGLRGDERDIVDTILARLHDGRRVYGPWRVDDGRNNPREALAEVMDALNYCAAELVRLSRGGAT